MFPAYRNIRDVSEVSSRLPTTPTFIPGAVPPTYFTRQSSAAAAGIAVSEERSRIRTNAVYLLTLHLLRYQSQLAASSAYGISTDRAGRCRTVSRVSHEGLFGGFRDPDHSGHTALDIVVGGGPARHRNAHGFVPVPLCAAAPAGSIRLDGGDHASSFFRVAEGDQHLIQSDFVQYGEPGGLKAIGKEPGLPAVAFDHLPQAAAA